MNEFVEFPKIARLSRECTVTEKIDGTNGQVLVHEGPMEFGLDCQVNGTTFVRAGSRSQWLSTNTDNFGFAKWVYANAYELVALGVGSHFGEWWGAGIQRRYGQDRKRFSLFNTHRWSDATVRPPCCDVVPIIYQGLFTSDAAASALESLRTEGSRAAPGFMNPEGVIIWHHAAQIYFKKTLSKDEEWKGKTAAPEDTRHE